MGSDGDVDRAATFVPQGGWRRWHLAYGGIVAFNAVYVLGSGLSNDGWLRWLGLGLAPFGFAFAAYIFLWTPRAVELDAAAVRLRAPARTISIPWADLEAVDEARGGLGRPLVWTRRRGRRIHTPMTWEDQDEMLVAIRQHITHGSGAQGP
jgi:hypothetical protein